MPNVDKSNKSFYDNYMDNMGESSRKDKALEEELYDKLNASNCPKTSDRQSNSFRNADVREALGNMPDTLTFVPTTLSKSSIQATVKLLDANGAFDFDVLKRTVDIDPGTPVDIFVPRTTTGPGDQFMRNHTWLRDLVRVAHRLLMGAKYLPVSVERQRELVVLGKKFLLSGASLMSTSSQRERFENSIKNPTKAEERQNCPHVYWDHDNLDGSKMEDWMHQQDAFQMLAVYLVDALTRGDLAIGDLLPQHRMMLGYVVPYLAQVDFANRETHGIWEEVRAKRSSVIIWDNAAITTLKKASAQPDFAFLRDQFEHWRQYLGQEFRSGDFTFIAEALEKNGAKTLHEQLPNESPTYDESDPRFRRADAALMYGVEGDTLARIQSLLGLDENWARTMQQSIYGQLQQLFDPETGAYRRYDDDVYQRIDEYRHTTQASLGPVYACGDSTSTTQFLARKALLTRGESPAWPLITWELAAASGHRWMQTKDTQDLKRHLHLVVQGLRSVTGPNEWTIAPLEKGLSVTSVRAWQFPECIQHIQLDDHGPDFRVVGPHAPLAWAQAAAIDALGTAWKIAHTTSRLKRS